MRINLTKTRWLPVMIVALLLTSFGAWVGTSGASSPKKTVTALFAPYRWTAAVGIGPSLQSVGKGSVACAASAQQGVNNLAFMWFDLADGAQITKVTVYYQDNDPTYSMTFSPSFQTIGVTDALSQFESGPYESVNMTGTSGSFNGMQALSMVPTTPVVVDRHSSIVPTDGASANREYGLIAEFGACGTTFDANGFPFPSLTVDAVSVDYILG